MSSDRITERPVPAPPGNGGPETEPRVELIYVSWGGTGMASTLRKALDRAASSSSGLVYLAILDNSTFGDIDGNMLALAKDELAWLLDAQLELARKQTGLDQVAVRVLVRSGDVAAEIIDAVETVGSSEVLIGAPVPEGKANAVSELVDHLTARVSASIGLLEP